MFAPVMLMAVKSSAPTGERGSGASTFMTGQIAFTPSIRESFERSVRLIRIDRPLKSVSERVALGELQSRLLCVGPECFPLVVNGRGGGAPAVGVPASSTNHNEAQYRITCPCSRPENEGLAPSGTPLLSGFRRDDNECIVLRLAIARAELQ